MSERIGKSAERMLGQLIEQKRRACGLSQMDLGRRINQKQQQIVKYEAGEFVPLPVLEAICAALDTTAPKRLIRRISFLRKLEMETETEQAELIPLYHEIFSSDSSLDD